MDNFLEEVATKRNKGLQTICYALCWLLMIVLGVIGLLSFSSVSSSQSTQSLIINIAVFAVCAGLVYLLWRYKDNFRTEYEYTFTNGDLDVSKVLGNARRKYLTSLPMKNVDACGKVESPSFARWINMPGVKKHNWFLNRDGNLIYFYFVKSNVKHLMIVELSEAMVQIIRSQRYLGFNVWQE